jgi:hypothetical protein
MHDYWYLVVILVLIERVEMDCQIYIIASTYNFYTTTRKCTEFHLLRIRIIMFNVTFNNISVLLVGENQGVMHCKSFIEHTIFCFTAQQFYARLLVSCCHPGFNCSLYHHSSRNIYTIQT